MLLLMIINHSPSWCLATKLIVRQSAKLTNVREKSGVKQTIIYLSMRLQPRRESVWSKLFKRLPVKHSSVWKITLSKCQQPLVEPAVPSSSTLLLHVIAQLYRAQILIIKPEARVHAAEIIETSVPCFLSIAISYSFVASIIYLFPTRPYALGFWGFGVLGFLFCFPQK